MQILVVDRCPDTVESLALLLRLDGYEVRTAHDGPTALEVACFSRPDVVLMDIALPKLDGYQVAQRLRQQENLAQALLVAVTGYRGEWYRRRSREAGFDYHLLKPLELQWLLEFLAARAWRNLGSGPGAQHWCPLPAETGGSVPVPTRRCPMEVVSPRRPTLSQDLALSHSAAHPGPLGLAFLKSLQRRSSPQSPWCLSLQGRQLQDAEN